MQKITMNELFSGIGAQKRGLDLTGVFDCEVKSTSDINKEAMLSYAAVHCGLTEEHINTYKHYPSRANMVDYLTSRNIGYDFVKKKVYDWEKQTDATLKRFYLACLLSKNIGDISRVTELPYADLWTLSFPCTDLSTAGKQEGLIKGKTRSGLLYEVERLLESTLTPPKYLLLENVKGLVGKTFKPDFDKWLERLDELGYNTYWQVLNGKDCGIPQNRERVFAVSIRKDIDTHTYEFPKPVDLTVHFKDLMDNDADTRYHKDATNKQIAQVLSAYSGSTVRRLTPTEAWRLMGFTDSDIDKCQDLKVTETDLIIQAGNSIITTCIQLLMEHLYKAQYKPDYEVSKPKVQLPTTSTDKYIYCLRYQRTEYAKRIRKDYEAGRIQEKISNMRELVPRTDGICNTLTTVQKDNYVLVLSAPKNKLSTK